VADRQIRLCLYIYINIQNFIIYLVQNIYSVQYFCHIKIVLKFNTAYEETWVFRMWGRNERRNAGLR